MIHGSAASAAVSGFVKVGGIAPSARNDFWIAATAEPCRPGAAVSFGWRGGSGGSIRSVAGRRGAVGLGPILVGPGIVYTFRCTGELVDPILPLFFRSE